MEEDRCQAVGQPDGGAREQSLVQSDPPDPPLGQRVLHEGGQQREDRGQQDRDRQFPDCVDVLDDAGILAASLGELDSGGDARQQSAEQQEVMRGQTCTVLAPTPTAAR